MMRFLLVRVHVIDLPDHEADPTPAATVTLEDYVRAIGAALRARGGRSVSAVTDCPNPEITP